MICQSVCACVCAFVCVCVFSLERLLELNDTVKHLRSQGAVKDASLDTMQISLDRMVRPPGSPL